jgi:AcrR family transcriptional regulator
MAQYLKPDIQEKIAAAALDVLATRGYATATIAEIARTAGISTGNVYRYYETKEVLFDDVVPKEFVEAFGSLVRRRLRALSGVEDGRALAPASAYHAATDELIRFAMGHRLRVVVLLGRAEGSRYAGFTTEMIEDLVRMAVAYLRSIRPLAPQTPTVRFNLTRIYRGLVSTTVEILSTFDDEETIRAALDEYSRYHLAGLKSLFS